MSNTSYLHHVYQIRGFKHVSTQYVGDDVQFHIRHADNHIRWRPSMQRSASCRDRPTAYATRNSSNSKSNRLMNAPQDSWEQDESSCLSCGSITPKTGCAETPWADGFNGVCNVAAILVEPFQSSAGYYIPPKAYLQELRRICDKFGILLIIDEIQAGLGRSGKLWAFQHSDIEPDMFVVSKALGGGLPISAVVAKSEILTEWGPGAHVSTQAGNVVACAAGNYVMDIVSDPKFLVEVNRIGDRFYKGWLELQDKHPCIGYVEHMGLYLSVEYVKDRKTKEPAAELTTFVRDQGVVEGLAFEKGGYWHNRTQMIPALNMPDDIMDEAFRRFDSVIAKAEQKFNIK